MRACVRARASTSAKTKKKPVRVTRARESPRHPNARAEIPTIPSARLFAARAALSFADGRFLRLPRDGLVYPFRSFLWAQREAH